MTRGTHRLSLALLLGSIVTASGAQPPPQEPPGKGPTDAELLVGRWQLVKFGEKPLPNTGREFLVFTTKGKYTSTVTSKFYPEESVTGSYRLNGDMIDLSTDPPQPLKTQQLTLVEVTKTRLIIRHGQQVGFRRGEYVRDEDKEK